MANNWYQELRVLERVSSISTASQIERPRAAASAVINPGGDAAGAGARDRKTRLAAAEAAAEMAKPAVAVSQAAVAAAAALHAEMEREEGRAVRSGAAASHRHQSGVVVAAGAPRCCRQSTATPEGERHGRCSPSRTTMSGAC